MRVIDREEVARRLTYEVCIPIVRQAMMAFSKGDTRQLLRSVIPLGRRPSYLELCRARWATMPAFGAKLVSVYPENFAKGRQSHQGLVVLFEPDTGSAGVRGSRGGDYGYSDSELPALSPRTPWRASMPRDWPFWVMESRRPPMRGRCSGFARCKLCGCGGVHASVQRSSAVV
jgi:hypothetical protein